MKILDTLTELEAKATPLPWEFYPNPARSLMSGDYHTGLGASAFFDVPPLAAIDTEGGE